MTCPIMVHLGVYALGAADPGERTLVETHLPGCPACRAELARLASLPGLLRRIPASLLTDDPLPARSPGQALPAGCTAQQARIRRAPARSWRSAVMSAAVAAAGLGAGYWLASPGASSPPAAVTLSGVNPVTHVRATVALTATSWGTSIRLQAVGLPLNQPCRLIVRSRTGATEVTGAWDAWSPGPVSIPASASWRPSDIASLQVATATENLVTITAWRPAAQSPRDGSRP
jgi:predicted anti-sigma-YlaC factor YlaD